MKRLFLLSTFFFLFLQLQAQDGALDRTYGVNGFVFLRQIFKSTDFTTEGKLVGLVATSTGFIIYRYNTDGTPDASFGSGGVVTSYFQKDDVAFLVKVQQDGKIVVGGHTRFYPAPFVSFDKIAFARYNIDGTRDATFGNGDFGIGLILIERGFNDTHESMRPNLYNMFSNNNKLYYLVSRVDRKFITSYTISTLGTDGQVQPGLELFPGGAVGNRPYSMAFQSNGKIVIGGSQNSPVPDSPTVLLLLTDKSNGTLDSSFGTNGYITSEVSPAITNLIIQDDGKILGSYGSKLFRFNTDGTFDVTFGNNGIVNTVISINKTVIQATGKIIVGGTLNRDFAVARYNTNGTIDLSFGNGGITTTDAGGSESIADMVIAGNKVYAFGNGLLFSYLLVPNTSTCTPPTFINNSQIVADTRCGKIDGAIYIVPLDGAAPFMYSIDGGTTYVLGPDTGYGFTNLAAGTYRLRLKDANGCESGVAERRVKEGLPPPILLNNNQLITDASCGNSNGAIFIFPYSGVSPFMYSINGGTTYVEGPYVGNSFTNLGAGTYRLKIKDANNCESEIVEKIISSVDINCLVCTPPTFINNSQIVLDATCGKNDGNISIIPTSGNAPFMYSIDGGITYVNGPNAGFTFNNLGQGIYKLRLKDATGCESSIVEKAVNQNKDCPLMTIVPSTGHAISIAEMPIRKAEVVLTYPNPSKGQFRLQLQNFISPKAEVSIFDGKGTLVEKKWVNAGEGSSTGFNISGHSKGMYYIKIVTSQGIRSAKILIQ